MLAVCSGCLENPAVAASLHSARLLPFCSQQCSEAYCISHVKSLGPKAETSTSIAKAGDASRAKSYSHSRQESVLWAADVVILSLVRPKPDDRKILIARRQLIYAPNREDVFQPKLVQSSPQSIVWQVEAHFDVRGSDFSIDAARIDQNTTQDERDPQEIAQIALVYSPKFDGYLKLTHLINFMTGPRSTEEEKQIFRGVGTLLLKSMLVYLMERYRWMFPQGRQTLVAVEAGSMRLNTAEREQYDQAALVKYYQSMGFVPDAKVPRDPSNDNTERMSATVETLLSAN